MSSATVFGAAGSKALDTSQGPKAPPSETSGVKPVTPAIPSDDPMSQDSNASWTARPDLAAEYPLMDRFTLKMYQHKTTGEIAAVKWVEAKDVERNTARAVFNHHKRLFSGQSLQTIVNTTGRMPEEQARVFITQLARALEHCDDQGVVNRDLHLEDNVESGVLKLCDFSYPNDYVKASVRTKVGSPVYMAPEMLDQPATSGKPSIWSHWRVKLLVLGVLLFSTVTGLARFYQGKAQSLDDLLHDVRNSIWHRPIAVALSPELDDLLHKLLALEPEKRPQSMEEVLQHPWFTKPGVHGAHAGSEPWQRTYGPTIHPDTTVHFADLTPVMGAPVMDPARDVVMDDDMFLDGVDVLLGSKPRASSVPSSLQGGLAFQGTAGPSAVASRGPAELQLMCSNSDPGVSAAGAGYRDSL